MTNRFTLSASIVTCALATFVCANAAAQEPEAFINAAATPAQIQAVALTAHGPSLVAYCQCGGLISSTGNLYFTNFGINEFGPSSASFLRTGKYSAPGTEINLYSETGAAYFNFGNVVWVLEGSAYYGYFVANYERTNPRYSQIKRVSLAGGPAVVLTTSYSYIGVGDLATDGTSLFWTDEGGIRKMSIDGGAVQTLVSGPAYSHISLDSSNVYYSSGTGIYKIPKSGGARTAIANAGSNVTALYAWPATPVYSFVFWGEQSGSVRSYSPFGGSVYTWQSPISGRSVSSVGYDGNRALWIDCTQPGNSTCTARIQSGGVTPTTVNAGVGASHLQWDSTSMYWFGGPGIQRYVY
jgi:hypothetical protein